MPPIQLKMVQVPAYVKTKYGLTITGRTAYNWVKVGLRNESLQTMTIKNPKITHKYPTIQVTTEKWVDEFITRTGVFANATPT